jgi:hypothetical protein
LLDWISLILPPIARIFEARVYFVNSEIDSGVVRKRRDDAREVQNVPAVQIVQAV